MAKLEQIPRDTRAAAELSKAFPQLSQALGASTSQHCTHLESLCKNQRNTAGLSGAAGLARRDRSCLAFILPPPQQLQQVLAHKRAVKIPVLVEMLGDEGSYTY